MTLLSEPCAPSRGVTIEEALADAESWGPLQERPVGNPKAGLFAGYITLEQQTYVSPALDFHILSIQGGDTLSLDFTSGFVRPPPRTCAFEDAFFYPADSAATFTLHDKPANNFRFFVPKPLLHETLENTLWQDVDPAAALQCLVSAPTPKFRQLGRLVRSEFSEGQRGDPAMMEALSAAFLIEFAHMYSDATEEARNDLGRGLSDRHRKAALDMMKQALDGAMNIEDIAETIGIEPYEFSRRFKVSIKATPSEHLMTLRLEEAKKLLSESNDPIADIAYRCGFSSQAHLTTRFGRSFGLTPARFRKLCRTQ